MFEISLYARELMSSRNNRYFRHEMAIFVGHKVKMAKDNRLFLPGMVHSCLQITV